MSEEEKEFKGAGDFGDVMDLVDEVVVDPNDDSKDKDKDKNDEINKDGTPIDNGSTDLAGDDDNIPTDLGDEPTKTRPDGENEDPEPEYEEPEGLTESASQAFKSMRVKIQEYEKQLRDNNGNDSNEVVDKLNERIIELQSKLSVTDLANSPEFQDRYGKPVSDVQAEIVRIAEEYDIDKDVALNAAKMSRSERINTLRREASDQIAVTELIPLYQDLERKILEGRKALEEHEKTRKELESSSSSNREMLQGKVFDNVLTDLQKEHFLLRESKENPKWLEAISHNAKLILSGKASSEDIVKAALKAQVSDAYKKLYIDLRAESSKKIDALEKKYGKIKESSPRIGSQDAQKTKKKETFGSVEDLASSVI